MKDITLISCSYNTPHVTSNMLKSFINFHPECEILICENSTDDVTADILSKSNIPYIRNKSGLHGPSVDLLLKNICQQVLTVTFRLTEIFSNGSKLNILTI